MLRKRMLAGAAAVMLAVGSASAAQAAEVECEDHYCFQTADFSEGDPVSGICITEVPKSGSVQLGSRQLRSGDILTAEQVARMTFSPVRGPEDSAVELHYLPIYGRTVAPAAVMTISVRGRTDQSPAAEDFTVETYRNLPLEGTLKATDPEGEALIYSVTRQCRRGEAVLRSDGSFTYTPKKNKTGVDSFTYTAADPAGNVSREATVTITILKPADNSLYQDTQGKSCRFSAEWMKNTGIFTGESVGGSACFAPEHTVSRGEFLAMLVRTLNLPPETGELLKQCSEGTPAWLRPYVAAALRAGLTAGLPDLESLAQPVTGAEAAVMVQNALDLKVTALPVGDQVPVWAEDSLAALRAQGFPLAADSVLTRGDTAELLYRIHCFRSSSI